MKITSIKGLVPALFLGLVASCSSLPKEAPSSVKDPAALKLFDKAIYGQDIASLRTLAEYYQKGSHGFPASQSTRLACLEKAAEAGDLTSQREVGLMYLYDQDDKEAAKWLSMAAAKGDATARRGLMLIKETEDLDSYESELVKQGRKRNVEVGRAINNML